MTPAETPSVTWSTIPAGSIPATTPVDPSFWANLQEGETVLDVGCGDGRVLVDCVDRGLQVTGIDVNVEAVKRLRRWLSKHRASEAAQVLVADAVATGFGPCTFRAALMQAVLATIDRSSRFTALAEAFRILLPGGLLHIAEFELIEDSPPQRDRYARDARITGEYGTIVVRDHAGAERFRTHNFQRDELVALVLKAGFSIRASRRATFTSYHGNRKSGLIVIAQKSNIPGNLPLR